MYMGINYSIHQPTNYSPHQPNNSSLMPYIVQNKPFSDEYVEFGKSIQPIECNENMDASNNNNNDHIAGKKSIDDTVENMISRETNETCNICEIINKCC